MFCYCTEACDIVWGPPRHVWINGKSLGVCSGRRLTSGVRRDEGARGQGASISCVGVDCEAVIPQCCAHRYKTVLGTQGTVETEQEGALASAWL